VVYVHLSPHPAREAEAWSWLDREEQERCARFLHEGPRRRFVLSRAAVRAILCERLDCRNAQLAFPTGRYGKPFATLDGRPAPASFNVSHSGAHGLIAYAPRGRLGVDIEERAGHRNLETLIEAVLGPDERAEVAATRGDRRVELFFALWTMKEALLKAHGDGFAFDAARFQIPAALRRGAVAATVRLPGLPAVRWRLENLGTETFAAAVAQELEAAS
jgi:4'-phosphopantetheinyl transferase